MGSTLGKRKNEKQEQLLMLCIWEGLFSFCLVLDFLSHESWFFFNSTLVLLCFWKMNFCFSLENLLNLGLHKEEDIIGLVLKEVQSQVFWTDIVRVKSTSRGGLTMADIKKTPKNDLRVYFDFVWFSISSVSVLIFFPSNSGFVLV